MIQAFIIFDQIIQIDRMSIKSNNICLIFIFGAFNFMIICSHIFLSFIFKYIYAYSSCVFFQVRNLTIFSRGIILLLREKF